MITIREKTVDEKITDLDAKYQPKFDAYIKLASTILASDGVNQATRIEELQAEYNALSDQKDIELLEILGGA